MILAGGLGTRLRSMVADRPKVLAPVCGRPFLSCILDQLDEAGISDRATVLIDKDGTVLWSESVGPGGQRQPTELLEKAQSMG